MAQGSRPPTATTADAASAAAAAVSPQRIAALEELLASKELQLTKLSSQLNTAERSLASQAEI